MQMKCEFQKKLSKDNKVYYVVFLPDIEKVIFLEPAELKLLKILYNIKD